MTIKQISISSNQGTTAAGTLEVQSISFNKRIVIAILLGTITLILAAISAVIPPHIIYPPLILAVGLYVTCNKFKQDQVIESGSGTCPACRAQVRFFKQKFKTEFSDFCEGCKRDLKIKISD